MSPYPPAADPADNNSLRRFYRSGVSWPIEVCFIKENGVPISAWVMRNTDINRARYNAIYDSENPPTTRAEALERAGATFFPRWYQCEALRIGEIETKATLLALGGLERTDGNMRLAELELQENPARIDEDRIAEERKTLAWVREEMQREGNPSNRATPPRGLEGAN
ncbi:hypothetical protein IFR05_001508 [Cadophora sp. M221]|nr:hypothetical protein IFR05_001508 [Cadophora sp. M221]